MARIEFKEEADGSVSYALVMEEGEHSFSPAWLAAFALAKRGLTRKEMDHYKLQGAFEQRYP